jgi:hypothetical protein
LLEEDILRATTNDGLSYKLQVSAARHLPEAKKYFTGIKEKYSYETIDDQINAVADYYGSSNYSIVLKICQFSQDSDILSTLIFEHRIVYIIGVGRFMVFCFDRFHNVPGSFSKFFSNVRDRIFYTSTHLMYRTLQTINNNNKGVIVSGVCYMTFVAIFDRSFTITSQSLGYIGTIFSRIRNIKYGK